MIVGIECDSVGEGGAKGPDPEQVFTNWQPSLSSGNIAKPLLILNNQRLETAPAEGAESKTFHIKRSCLTQHRDICVRTKGRWCLKFCHLKGLSNILHPHPWMLNMEILIIQIQALKKHETVGTPPGFS